MGQRPRARLAPIFALVMAAALACGCDRRPAGSAPATRAARVTAASLSPAATDLIVGMGAREHLVGISQYDKDRPDVKGLPLVGDYLSMDWEQLAAIRPAAMIIQIAPEKLPQGVKERAEALGIRLVNVRIDRLEDIFKALDVLGEALGEEQKAKAAGEQMRRRLQAVKARVAGRARVRALIALDDKAEGVAGRNNYLNDLLELAGGENAMGAEWGPYPRIDREMLLKVSPEAVLQLILDNNDSAKSTAELAREHARMRQTARDLWQTMPALPAVRQDRVSILTDWYILLPGYHVADVAEQFARCLHPGEGEVAKP